MDDDSDDIYQTSLIEMLPDQISSIKCALQSLLPTTPRQELPEDETSDVLPTPE